MSRSVALYFLDLRTAPPSLQDRLSADEQQRAAALADPLVRRQWTLGRAWLRRLLSERLGRPAASFAFGRGPHGKPFVVDAPGFGFSLSHAGSMLACAMGDDAQLGVDIEPLDRQLAPADHWWRVLPAHELRVVGRSRRRFLQAWVRKESILKAEGTGLGYGSADAARWRLASGSTRGHCWSLACRGPARELQLIETEFEAARRTRRMPLPA